MHMSTGRQPRPCLSLKSLEKTTKNDENDEKLMKNSWKRPLFMVFTTCRSSFAPSQALALACRQGGVDFELDSTLWVEESPSRLDLARIGTWRHRPKPKSLSKTFISRPLRHRNGPKPYENPWKSTKIDAKNHENPWKSPEILRFARCSTSLQAARSCKAWRISATLPWSFGRSSAPKRCSPVVNLRPASYNKGYIISYHII